MPDGDAVDSFAELDPEDGKLVKGDGRYSLRVHSNLWYEWEAA